MRGCGHLKLTTPLGGSDTPELYVYTETYKASVNV